jgi:hypothetical protein
MLTLLQGRTWSEEVPPKLIVPHGITYEKKVFLFNQLEFLVEVIKHYKDVGDNNCMVNNLLV